MKTSLNSIFVAACTLLAGSGMAHAQITSSYDFNLDDGEGTISPTESGFTGITTTSANSGSATLDDGISLEYNGFFNAGGRDRGTADLTVNADFFRDGFTGNDSGGKEIDFSFSGLEANIDYEFTFWAWERQFSNDDVTVEFYNTTDGGSTLISSVDLVGVQPTSPTDYSTNFTISSNAAGEITLDVFGVTTSDPSSSEGVLINGFEITAIPEPGTFALIAGVLGFGVVILRRRRRFPSGK